MSFQQKNRTGGRVHTESLRRGKVEKMTHKMGYYGCSGELVKIKRKARGKPPMTAVLDCPICDKEHPVNIMWRNVLKDELLYDEPDLVMS